MCSLRWGLPAVIGIVFILLGIFMIRKFGRLGAICQRFRLGQATPEEIMYVQRQPSWILNNPSLCTFFGNIAPFILIGGVALLLAGI